MKEFDYTKDSDGIVTISMDMDGPVNAMNSRYRELMDYTLDSLEQESGLTGVVIASAKSTFFAGGDLNELLSLQPGDEQASENIVKHTKAQLRRLETLPVPVVAAINGAALGGGFELCLACNRRIAWDSPKTIVGLPEVTLGLLPGAGGVVRMVNLLGLEKALPFLLEGNRLKPDGALQAGLVAELVPEKDELIPKAKSWIKANPDAWQQPWDKKGHTIPGGNTDDQAIKQLLIVTPPLLRKKTRGLLPAPERILAVAAETLRVDFDTAMAIESHALTYLALTPVCKNMITSTFFQMNKFKALDTDTPEQRAFIARVSEAYLDEGQQLLHQGVAPFIINKLAQQIGMLKDPLAADETSASHSEQNLSPEDIKDRLLFRQVIESLKCLEEGVLRSVAEGNIGSLLEMGAPVWTGGFIQFVNTYGLDTFIARTRKLADQYGERFLPPAILMETAKQQAYFV